MRMSVCPCQCLCVYAGMMHASACVALETLTNPSSKIEEEPQKGVTEITYGGLDAEKPL